MKVVDLQAAARRSQKQAGCILSPDNASASDTGMHAQRPYKKNRQWPKKSAKRGAADPPVREHYSDKGGHHWRGKHAKHLAALKRDKIRFVRNQHGFR